MTATDTTSQWATWLAARTDALFDVEQRTSLYGTAQDQAATAKAFVLRAAIADRLAEMSAAAPHLHAQIAARPLVDAQRNELGADLVEGATSLDRLLAEVAARLDTSETARLREIEDATTSARLLDEIEPLARRLGVAVNQAADLRRDLDARRDLAACAAEAATLVDELRAMDQERLRLLERLDRAGERVVELRAAEDDLRALAARCQKKVVQAPRIGIPSTDALPPLPLRSEADALTFPALRNVVGPALMKLERLAAAFAEATRMFQAPLDERGALRGLLQAFRSKAADGGHSEDPVLEPAYRAAEQILWAAPCDLVAAREAVDSYAKAVNEAVS